MTLKELKALQNNGLASHPWKQRTVNILMYKIKREKGDQVWKNLLEILKQARYTKNADRWLLALAPFFEDVVDEKTAAENAEKSLKDRKILALEAKRQALVKSASKDKLAERSDIIRLNSQTLRRKGSANEDGDTKRFSDRRSN